MSPCFHSHAWRIVSALLLLLGLANGVHAIVASDDSALHGVVAGEPSYGLNLAGVALIGWEMPGGDSLDSVLALCTGAVISDRHLLTAAHCFDVDEDGNIDELLGFISVVAAFELPDGALLRRNIAISKIQIPDDWPEARADIAVIDLAEALPAAIPRYRAYGGFDEVGQPIVVAGYGMIGSGATGAVASDDDSVSPGKHAGLNRVDAVYLFEDIEFLAYDFDNGRAEQNALAFDDVESDLGFGDDEAMPASGDSGGPVFIDGAIAGVISFGRRLQQPGIDVNAVIDSSWGEVHFDTRVASFQHFLIDATNDEVVFHKLVGDFDASGRRDVADIDLLNAALRAGSTASTFDLDGSGTVDSLDRAWWIDNLMRTHLGDANLDRRFASDDLVAVFTAGKYEQDVAALWPEGDWNGDGRFNAHDLTDAFQDGGYELTPPAAIRDIPEPCGAVLFVLGTLGIFRKRSSRNA